MVMLASGRRDQDQNLTLQVITIICKFLTVAMRITKDQDLETVLPMVDSYNFMTTVKQAKCCSAAIQYLEPKLSFQAETLVLEQHWLVQNLMLQEMGLVLISESVELVIPLPIFLSPLKAVVIILPISQLEELMH